MELEITTPTQIPEDKPLMKFFEDWQQRERGLVRAKEGLTEQINRQNMNIQKLGLRHQTLQQAMNTSEVRCRSLHSCYSQAQQACVQLNEDLQEERQKHKMTRQELEFEFKEHNRTEQELERHYFTLNRLSEFLTMVQVSSREDKAVVMDCFNNDHSIGNLMLDIEAKKQLIANLEHKLNIAKKEYEYSISSHHEAIQMKDTEIAELEGNQALSQNEADQEMTGTVPSGKKAKTNRKGRTPKTRIPMKIEI